MGSRMTLWFKNLLQTDEIEDTVAYLKTVYEKFFIAKNGVRNKPNAVF